MQNQRTRDMTMSHDEQTVLTEHYARCADDEGLVDVKYCLSNPTEASVEQVARDVNRMHRALAAREATPLKFNDSRRA